MSILARIISVLVYSGNVLVILFGLYGYIWRSRFVSGESAGPFWIFRAYQDGAPVLFYTAALGLVLFWVFRLLAGLADAKMGADSNRLFNALRVATVLGAVSALPACDVNYNLVETTDFGSSQYHLVQVVDGGAVAYGVFECQDVGSFYCQIITNDNRPWQGTFPQPPPTPTPLPTVVIIVENEPVILEPQAMTPTPPAEFLINSYEINGVNEEELTVKIGDGYVGISHIEVTPTPTP